MKRCGLVPILGLAFGFLAHAGSAPPIVVFTAFEHEPSAESVSHMKLEVASILAPSGLQLDWRALDSTDNGQSFPDLVVLKFRGSCQVRNPAMDSELGPSVEGYALATTAVSGGRVLPFSDVKCDQIRRFLALDLGSADAADQERLYGKALGRVVAHELYHIFAGTEQHAREGVARSFHTRRDLTGKQFRFTPKETAELHDVKWRALLAGEGGVL